MYYNDILGALRAEVSAFPRGVNLIHAVPSRESRAKPVERNQMGLVKRIAEIEQVAIMGYV